MVSFDVKSLFITVPIDDSLTIIRDRLSADKDLEDRTTLSVFFYTKCGLTRKLE